MYGNINEWCSDRVYLGGAYYNKSLNRIKEKNKQEKTYKSDSIGFRISFKIEKGKIYV